MEKQPVDDLFARKLREAEAPVSPDMFNQLQQRMGAKPLPVRRPMIAWWHMASAACLLVALCFLYVTNKMEPPINKPVARKVLPETPGVDRLAGNRPNTALKQKQQTENGIDRTSKTSELTAKTGATYPEQKQIDQVNQHVDEKPLSIRPQEVSQQLAQVQRIEVEPVQTTTLAINPAPIERIERVTDKPKQAAERIIVLTIIEPQPVTSLAAMKINGSTSDAQQTHQNGLSGLFGKLKQLKNGEVLAKATPASTQNNQKNRLGRVFTEVKESLKNETTLE